MKNTPDCLVSTGLDFAFAAKFKPAPDKNNLFPILLLLLALPLFGQPTVEIWEIQGAGAESPFAGQRVRSENNLVIAVSFNAFYIQTPTARTDGDPSTSDGLRVNFPQGPTVTIGDQVTITGDIIEFQNQTAFSTIDLEVEITGSGAEVPPPFPLDANFPDGGIRELSQLEAVEGMHVRFEGGIWKPANGGELPLVSARRRRPFREPGIPFPGIPGLPVFDGNPELFAFEADALGAPFLGRVNAGTALSATGIIVQNLDAYRFQALEYELDERQTLRPVRAAAAEEFTVGALNCFNLNRNFSDYTQKRRKLANYIVEVLGAPNLMALQEVRSNDELNDLIQAIRELDNAADYRGFLNRANDDINLAFLLRTEISQASVDVLGDGESFELGGRLFFRPPFLLTITLPDAPGLELQLLNLHLRSRLGIEGEDSTFVRQKRHAQAVRVAEMVEDLRDDNLIVLGDFNAFQFTDGYADVVNQISGQPTTLPSLIPTREIVDPPLVNHSLTVDSAERYSFIFESNSQILDHCLANELTGLAVNELQYGRGNADAASSHTTDPETPLRGSDHDGFVLFLQPTTVSTHEPVADPEGMIIRGPNPARAGDVFTVENDNRAHRLRLIDLQGRIVFERTLAGSEGFALPAGLGRGAYLLWVLVGEQWVSRRILVM